QVGLDSEHLLPQVLVDAVEGLSAEAGSLWLIDDTGEHLVCQSATGGTADQLEGTTIPLGAGIVGAVAATRRAEIISDTCDDPRFLFQVDHQTGFTTRSMVCVPVICRGECLGALQVINPRSLAAVFQQEDLEALETIAGY